MEIFFTFIKHLGGLNKSDTLVLLPLLVLLAFVFQHIATSSTRMG